MGRRLKAVGLAVFAIALADSAQRPRAGLRAARRRAPFTASPTPARSPTSTSSPSRSARIRRVLQDFFHWRVPLTTGALYRWGATDTRGVLSLSTATGAGEEMITPRQIAKGDDDRYMTPDGERRSRRPGRPSTSGLMAEMNGHWNAYSAYNADGSLRRNGHCDALVQARLAALHADPARRLARSRSTASSCAWDCRGSCGRSRRDDPVYEGGPDGIPLPDPERDAAAAGGDDVGAAELRLAEHLRQPARRLLARRQVRRLGRDRHLLEVRRRLRRAACASSSATTSGRS